MSTYTPTVTSVPRSVEILTFEDLVDGVLDQFALDRSNSRNVRRARIAASKAVRDIANAYRWSYFRRMWVLTLSDYFSDGTVAVDASTRTATFTETLPSWAGYGTLQILGTAEDGPEYEVEQRVSDTTLLLRDEANLAADQAATSSYRLVRRYYRAPIDLKEILTFRDVENENNLIKMPSPAMADSRVYSYREPDIPRMFQLRGYPSSFGVRMIEISPPPDDDYICHVAYIAHCRPLHHDSFETRVTAEADSTTVTSSVELPENIAGSVIRVGKDKATPTRIHGSVSGKTNPWLYQRVVASRVSATTFTVDSAFGAEVDGFGAVISDPVDIYVESMLSAVMAAAEMEFAIGVNAEPEKIGRMKSRARDELRLAIENDSTGVTVVRGGSLVSWPVTDYGATYSDGTNYPS